MICKIERDLFRENCKKISIISSKNERLKEEEVMRLTKKIGSDGEKKKV
jgi:hypothetical protein